MGNMISRRSIIVLFVLTILLTLSACQADKVDAPAEATGADAATDAAADEATAEGPLTVDVEFGPGTFNLTEPAVGLAELASYQATLILSFDGTQDGQPSQWSRTYVMLASKEPLARQLTIETTGDVPDPDPVFMAELSETYYEQQGENACSASPLSEGSSLAETWEPAYFMSGVVGADEAGGETLNGVEASRYTFDERALGQAGIAPSTGDMWVASEGGYILKYVLATEAGEEYFGDGTEGTLSWNYEVTKANQPVALELPEGCPAEMVDAPLLPDASDVLNIPGLIGYTTVTSVADAAAFYQEELPSLGWQPLGTPGLSETSAMLEYTQNDQQLSVIIALREGVITVHIMVRPFNPEAVAAP